MVKHQERGRWDGEEAKSKGRGLKRDGESRRKGGNKSAGSFVDREKEAARRALLRKEKKNVNRLGKLLQEKHS